MCATTSWNGTAWIPSDRYAHNLSAADVLVCGGAQHLRAIGWRPLGHPGAHYVCRRRQPRCGSRPHRHGHCLGRRLDQPHPALLGHPGAGHRQAQCQGHYGVLPHRPLRERPHHLRRPAGVGGVSVGYFFLAIVKLKMYFCFF